MSPSQIRSLSTHSNTNGHCFLRFRKENLKNQLPDVELILKQITVANGILLNMLVIIAIS